MNNLFPFTPSEYRDLFKALFAPGHRCVSFDDVDSSRRDLVLRHDINMSLEKAAHIAKIEVDLGVRSSWRSGRRARKSRYLN